MGCAAQVEELRAKLQEAEALGAAGTAGARGGSGSAEVDDLLRQIQDLQALVRRCLLLLACVLHMPSWLF